MKIYVDIDETICYYSEERNYPLAKTIKNNTTTANNNLNTMKTN